MYFKSSTNLSDFECDVHHQIRPQYFSVADFFLGDICSGIDAWWMEQACANQSSYAWTIVVDMQMDL
jgi:hypothetical protein